MSSFVFFSFLRFFRSRSRVKNRRFDPRLDLMTLVSSACLSLLVLFKAFIPARSVWLEKRHVIT